MRALVLAAALSLAACAGVQGAGDRGVPFSGVAPAAAAAPAAAPAGSYPVSVDLPAGAYRSDPNHTSVLFRIRHEGLAWFTVRLKTSQMDLTLDPADPSKSTLQSSIDLSGLDTNVSAAFNTTVANAIGMAATPRVTFNSTAIERTGQNTARVTGDLTMNGQTHPATLDVTFDGGHADPLRGHTVLGFSAHTTITRSQWGVTNWAAFTGDEVQVVIEAELVKT